MVLLPSMRATRSAGQIEGEISGRENVQDVGAPDLRHQPREIQNAGQQRANVFGSRHAAEPRIDREKTDLDRRLARESAQQLIRLYRLSADDGERRRDQQHAKWDTG
jgi:hypothetical protein